MFKKIVLSSMVSMLLMSGTALAQTTTPSTTTSTTGSATTRLECRQTAHAAYVSAVKAATDAYKATRKQALADLKSAKDSAKALTDKTAKKVGLRAANKAYAATIKQAKADRKKADRDALHQLFADRKACPAK